MFTGHCQGPLQVALGTSLGSLTLATALGFTGLAGILLSYPVALRAVAIVGGIVLMLMVLQAIRTSGADLRTDTAVAARKVVGASYIAVIVNPKALAVYLFVAPATMDTIDLTGYLAFAGVHSVLLHAWLGAFTYLAARWPGEAASTTWRRWLLRGAGAYLVVLGLTLWMH